MKKKVRTQASCCGEEHKTQVYHSPPFSFPPAYDTLFKAAAISTQTGWDAGLTSSQEQKLTITMFILLPAQTWLTVKQLSARKCSNLSLLKSTCPNRWALNQPLVFPLGYIQPFCPNTG